MQTLLVGVAAFLEPSPVRPLPIRPSAPRTRTELVAGKIGGLEVSDDGTVVLAIEDGAHGSVTLYRVAAESAAPIEIRASDARDHVIGPDGLRVLYRAGDGEHLGLYSVAAQAAPVELVAASAFGGAERAYAVGPDGRTAAFTSTHEDGVFARLYAASTEGGALTVLSPPRFQVEDFRFYPDGRSLVYRGHPEVADTSELYSVAIDGRESPVLLARGEGLEDFAVNPTGDWLVYVRSGTEDGRSELASVPLDRSSEPIVLERGIAPAFRFDPRGRVVLYLADRDDDDRLELYGASIDGARRFELSAPLATDESVAWFAPTADGDRVVYLGRHDGYSELWQVARGRGFARNELAELDVSDTSAIELAPDGTRLAFLSTDGALHGLVLDGRSNAFLVDAGPVANGFRIQRDGRVVYAAADRLRTAVIANGAAPVDLLTTSGGGGTQALGGTVGFRDFSYGTTGSSTPTGEKPECKLWFTHGTWWACLYNDTAQAYLAYWLNPANQHWINTGSFLELRNGSKVDVLWEESSQKLFVASHTYSTNPMPTPGGWGRLGRFSFNATNGTYTIDAGFPVNITRGSAEALTIAKDSFGRLWATWVEAGHVMINNSLDNHTNWGEPFVLPTPTSTVSNEDISAVLSFGGNRIGVMWSNQSNVSTRFVVHNDADPANVWQTEEIVLPDLNCGGACSDDHISVKADSQGRVFAVLKTSNTLADDPLNMVCMRGSGGGWTSTVFGKVSEHHTRAILLIDEQNHQVHVFATSPEAGGSIYRKSSPMSPLGFAPGVGIPTIVSPLDLKVNNVTSTKQSLDGTTDLVVLASDHLTHFYLHNVIDLDGGAQGPPSVTKFDPKQGVPERSLVVAAPGFTATGVEVDGIAARFTVLSGEAIEVAIPAEVSKETVRVTVITPEGVTERTVELGAVRR